MLKKYILVALLTSVGLGVAHAQDIQFSQFYAVPTYQNPAFAGSAHAPGGQQRGQRRGPLERPA